jgi:hypothetical protein
MTFEYQCANKASYGALPGGSPALHYVSFLSLWFFLITQSNFQLYMEVRLVPALGGDGSTIGIGVLNDTGSTVLTSFYMDLAALGNNFAYWRWLADVSVLMAALQTEWLKNLLVEIRLVDSVTLEPWGKKTASSATLCFQQRLASAETLIIT